jgi:hypothetical protein
MVMLREESANGASESWPIYDLWESTNFENAQAA